MKISIPFPSQTLYRACHGKERYFDCSVEVLHFELNLYLFRLLPTNYITADAQLRVGHEHPHPRSLLWAFTMSLPCFLC